MLRVWIYFYTKVFRLYRFQEHALFIKANQQTKKSQRPLRLHPQAKLTIVHHYCTTIQLVTTTVSNTGTTEYQTFEMTPAVKYGQIIEYIPGKLSQRPFPRQLRQALSIPQQLNIIICW